MNQYHINKWDFKVPYVCGARNLGEGTKKGLDEGASSDKT